MREEESAVERRESDSRYDRQGNNKGGATQGSLVGRRGRIVVVVFLGLLVVVFGGTEDVEGGVADLGGGGGGEEGLDGGVEVLDVLARQAAGAGEEVGFGGEDGGEDGGEEDGAFEERAGDERGVGLQEGVEREREDRTEVQEDGVARGEACQPRGGDVGGDEVEGDQGEDAREGNRPVERQDRSESRADGLDGAVREPRRRGRVGQRVQEGQQVHGGGDEAHADVRSVRAGFVRFEPTFHQRRGFRLLFLQHENVAFVAEAFFKTRPHSVDAQSHLRAR
mmetsp:Transcript_10718/g.32227  ORF Transcript_10718/g.32227 Transcript_10718/m.32227 type:complete len:280 (-) Transcript_10718:537-1376(-)